MPGPLSAQSFMVGNAPGGASYTPPQVDFSPLGKLTDDYFKGTQQARTLKLQNAFPEGLPKDETGNPDLNQITNRLTQLGGADYAAQMMPFIFEMKGLELAGRPVPGESGLYGVPEPPQVQTPNGGSTQAPSPNQRSSTVPGASGPANITGNRTSAPPGAQPKLSSAGADDQGQDSLSSIAAETGVDIPQQVVGNLAKKIGVGDPSQPLTPDQVTMARTVLSRVAQAQRSSTTGAGAPVIPVGGTSGNGSPVQGTTPETAAPATGIVPQVPPSQPTRPAQPQQSGAPSLTFQQQTGPVPGVPPGVNPEAYAQQMMRVAQQYRQRALQFGAIKNQPMADAADKKATALETQANNILEFMRKQAETTPEQKNVASGAPALSKAQEGYGTGAINKLAGITGAAQNYERDMQHSVELSRGLLNDPDMYTGFGGDIVASINKMKNAGYGDKAAQLQEVMGKITAQSINTQMLSMRDNMQEAGGPSSQAGRIFQSQADLMKKASQELGNTLEGNRALTEIQRRTGEQQIAIRDLAAQYLGPMQNGVGTRHPFLDIGFDQAVTKYLDQHPMFTPRELTNPKLLGVPTLPPTLKGAQIQDWGQRWNLKPGDMVRVGDGYMAWDPGHQQRQPGAAQAAPR